MLKPRHFLRALLHVIPACLVLLSAAVSGASGAHAFDISVVPFERLGQPLKLAHRATAPELSAPEEFGIDDATERHAKILPRVPRAALPISWLESSGKSSYRAPLRPYRCCAAPPTGPPHV